MEEHLKLAANLNDAQAVAFCEKLQHAKAETTVIGISDLNFVEPFGTLVVASQIRKMQERGRTFKLAGYADANGAHTYLAHIGFFKLLGFDLGKNPGEASGSDSYLPITVLSRPELDFDEVFEDIPLQKAISTKSEQLAKVLTQSHNMKVYGPVAYCFREMIRNVFEHAETDECFIAGQAYKGGRVTIAVVDYGRGLRASLNERHSVENDLEAIKLAIRPGISRVEIDPNNDNFYSNSGFGLYVLSELGAASGSFKLMSGDSWMGVNSNGCWQSSCLHIGTAMKITFSKPYGRSMEKTLIDIIERGESIAKQEGRFARASRSSQTATDF